MQNVSAAFSPYADARWSDMKVSFRLVDTTAAGNATASASGVDSTSQLSQTHDGVEGMSTTWATLEYGSWPLDGSRVGIPESVTGFQTGFWSTVSDGNRVFVTPPTLTFDFTNNHSSVGFMLYFDDKEKQFPKTFMISAYNSSGVLIDSITINCITTSPIIEFSVSNYRKLVFTFTETQAPYQRVKLSEVVFGIVQFYDRNNLVYGSLLCELSPTSEYLPSNELIIKIDNSNKKYNMINPNGIYSYLQQSQPLDAMLGVGPAKDDVEDVNMGRFFYAKSSAEDSSMTAQIVAYDPFYQLDKSLCKIGITGTWTVAAAVAAVIVDSGLSITASIPALIGNRTIRKCIPKTATHRETLRLIAQAGMSTCYFNRSNVLVFVTVVAGAVVDTLDNNYMLKVAKITVADRINTIKLTAKDDYAGTETVYSASDVLSGETAQIWSVSNPLVSDGASVSAWLLSMSQHRLRYELKERGNPARELCDTVKVYDAYNENKNVVTIKEQFNFNGALSEQSWGWA